MSDPPDLEAFRSEVRSWLLEHAPEELRGLELRAERNAIWGGRRAVFDPPVLEVWLRRMAERGWTAPTWPTEYGGGGLSGAQAKVLAQELAGLRLPPPLIGFGLDMIGPTLLQFGSEEQKRQHLPAIVRGEIRWCQGYSEPDSGSDLASLQTRARRDGDHFVVDGAKVWTSYADRADWMFALVRTNPEAKKQEGITFLLLDMETPGVSVKPIRLISGSSPFCETRFEGVRVPVANAVGGIDRGWSVAKALLGYERSMIANAFGTARGRARSAGPGGESSLVRQARSYGFGDSGTLEDGALRAEIARLEMNERAFQLTTQRSRDSARAGHEPGPETSLFKLYATELNQDRYELMVRMAGAQGLGWEGPGYREEELELTRSWLRSRGNSIEGGTSEIQLNIIAKRVLRLPG